jgi:hypothetical protein
MTSLPVCSERFIPGIGYAPLSNADASGRESTGPGHYRQSPTSLKPPRCVAKRSWIAPTCPGRARRRPAHAHDRGLCLTARRLPNCVRHAGDGVPADPLHTGATTRWACTATPARQYRAGVASYIDGALTRSLYVFPSSDMLESESIGELFEHFSPVSLRNSRSRLDSGEDRGHDRLHEAIIEGKVPLQ